MFDVPAPLYEGVPVDRIYLPPPAHFTSPPTPPTHYPNAHMGSVGCRTVYSGPSAGM